MAAVANIPPADDVEMQDVNPPLDFNPEVGRTGYDHNLVQTAGKGAPGSSYPVTEQENRMLDDDTQLTALGNGRPGSNGHAGRPITNRK